MNEWQPIATAPKDGAPILACCPGWERAAVMWWAQNTRLRGDPNGMKEWYWTDTDELDDYDSARPENWPTLWQPIPEPPPK